jgi:UDP-arabinose 4-epimerase
MHSVPEKEERAPPEGPSECVEAAPGTASTRSARRHAISIAMSVLIVGGAGYIGSQTAKRVARAGLSPVVLDNLVYGHPWAVKWGPFVEGDLADSALVARVLREHEVTSVIHFAAYAYVGESVANPRKYFRNNVVNTLNLLDAMVDAGVKNLVFSSTCATYGEPREVPIAESHPQRPVNPYGESKLAVEKILHWYAGAYGIRFAALRYFNAAGADPDGELGEDHDPETHLIPLAIAAALGQGQLSIFGTDYPTVDGTAIRDYIHVADLAGAHWLALLHLERAGGSLRLNLGTGKGHSVRQVIAAVERISGRKVPVQEAGRRAGDPPVLVADAREAANVLRWRPDYPDLETIVEHAFRWHERHHGSAGA